MYSFIMVEVVTDKSNLYMHLLFYLVILMFTNVPIHETPLPGAKSRLGPRPADRLIARYDNHRGGLLASAL